MLSTGPHGKSVANGRCGRTFWVAGRPELGAVMSVEQLPSGSVRARLLIAGVKHAKTFPTEEEANDWILVTKASAITGGLPKRISVRDYAARWMATYEGAPSSTRSFYQGNLDRYILPAIGSRLIADVTPTEISRMLNHVRATVSAATADAAYRTCSALFNSAAADDIMLRS